MAMPRDLEMFIDSFLPFFLPKKSDLLQASRDSTTFRATSVKDQKRMTALPHAVEDRGWWVLALR